MPTFGFCPDCMFQGGIEFFATMTEARLLDNPDVGLGTCIKCYEER